MASFSVDALRAAAPGAGRLMASLAGGGGGGSFEDAKNKEITLQSKLAQALSQMDMQRSTTNLNNLKIEEGRAEQAARAPEAVQRNAMVANGVPLGEESAISSWLKTGGLGPKYDAPADGGPALERPDWAGSGPALQVGSGKVSGGNDGVLGSIARMIGATNNALSVGDKNSLNAAKVASQGREDSLADGVMRGTVDPTLFAKSQYAAKGSAPFSFHEFGTGNNLTGQVDDSSQPAQRFGKLRVEETGRNVAAAGASKASAANSYASAAQHKMQTDKIRQDIEMGGKGSIQQTDQGLMLVNPIMGTAKAIVGADGKPLMGKNADKPLPPGVVKSITEARDNAVTINGLNQSFKPDFAGKGVLGFGADLQMGTSGNLGVDKDAVEWWKNYRKQAELVERHALFGAALTPTEQASWRSADIGPGMNADVVKRNLKTRSDLSRKIFENAAQDQIDAGHSAPRINTITGRAQFQDPDPSGPARITNDAEYEALPSGASFIGPDGRQRRKP